jgi:hypothetical protein
MKNTRYHNIGDARPESVISPDDQPRNFVVSGLRVTFRPGKALSEYRESTDQPTSREVSWIGTYTSGQALSFCGTLGASTFWVAPSDAQRVNTSNKNPHTVNEWFDTSQFVPQMPFTVQNTSTALANLRGPGIGMWNIPLAKDTAITERLNSDSKPKPSTP